jgi:hypothetical protein
MAKYPRFMRRGTRYIVRAVVPLDLHPILGRREIKKRLKTSDYRTATRLYPAISAMIDREIANAWAKHNSSDETRSRSHG